MVATNFFPVLPSFSQANVTIAAIVAVVVFARHRVGDYHPSLG
jgi:hypothetical protein